MWLINSKTFLSDPSTILRAQNELLEAQRQNSLSILVGNSFTQFSAFLRNDGQNLQKSSYLGWERALRTALDLLAPSSEEALSSNAGSDLALFIIAQAMCTQHKDARNRFVEQLKIELLSPIAPSPLHQFLLDLQPNSIITTNCDLLLERAAATRQQDWEAIVAHGIQQRVNALPIYKINGSLKPDSSHEAKYTFPPNVNAENVEQTVVIAGEDFEERAIQLTRPLHPVVNALSQTLLIIGKSLNPLDTAFMS